MKLVLTAGLHQFLLNGGHKYCLSDTTSVGQDEDAFTSITLKPVKKDPMLRNLPKPFEMYYNLACDPLKMASGRIDFLIRVKLTKKDFQKYFQSRSYFRLKEGSSHQPVNSVGNLTCKLPNTIRCC